VQPFPSNPNREEQSASPGIFVRGAVVVAPVAFALAVVVPGVVWAGAPRRRFRAAMQGARAMLDAILEAWPLLLAAAGVVGAVLLAVAGYRRHRRRHRAERFEVLFEAAPGPLLLLDEDRRVREANASACELMGRPFDRLRGRRLDDFLEADGTGTPQAAFEEVETTLRRGDEGTPARDDAPSAQTDARLGRPDDETARQVRLRLRALTFEGRRHTAATLQDMTAVKKEYAFFEGFHRRTVEDLPIELAVLSPEGTYLYANPQACPDEIAPQWLEEKTDFDLCRRLGLHPEVALRRRSHRRRALQERRRVRFEEVLSRRDAPPRHVERFYTPVFGDDSEIHAVVTYALDRTDQYRREDALEEAERAAEEYEKMKATLLRNLSHEFRTPLTGILSAAEVLADEVQTDQQDFVEIVEDNGRRLLRTLEAMLDLTGAQTGSLDQEPRVVSLAEAVEEVIGELAPEAEEKGLFLRKQALAEEAFVRVDPAGLYRILRTLVGNAVKFTEEGGIVVEIEEDGPSASLRVIDTGVGIDETYLPQLFDSFGQEDGSATRAFEGAGVGLSVAQRLLALMGGEVEVDSEKGEGSVFTVTLPLALRDAGGERPRVLLVEENEEQERILRHHLDGETRLTVARTLDGALEAAGGERFAAVLVSAGLRPEEGTVGAFVERFREAEQRPGGTPLVAIDEDGFPGAPEQFEAGGYDGYVARPIQRDALFDAIGHALAGGNPLVGPVRESDRARPVSETHVKEVRKRKAQA
jgi:signal transduction histidine kinase